MTDKDKREALLRSTTSLQDQYYRYKMVRRPFDIGCQPNGWMSYVEADKRADGYYGIVTYQEELTDEQVAKYELELWYSQE